LLGWIIMWLIAGAAGVLVAFWFAFREARRRELLAAFSLSPRRVWKGNPGVVRFAFISNVHSSLVFLPGHIATFSVGLVLGPQSAGLMKVAQELGSGLAKPIDLVNQTVYPDIARLAAEGAWQRVRKVVRRAGAMAAGISTLITLALIVGGHLLIRLVFGAEFEDAYLLLVLISVATTLMVSVFAVDPTLYAVGKPSRPLVTAAASNVLFVIVMFASFGPLGLLAPGAAWLAAAVTTIVLASWWMVTVIPRSGR
jgi:O-antigen/teichoic acid export membrane protein